MAGLQAGSTAVDRANTSTYLAAACILCFADLLARRHGQFHKVARTPPFTGFRAQLLL